VLVGVIMTVASAVVSAVAVMLVIRYAVPLRLVAAPNERSSHSRPTPTGGGIGIALGALVAGLPLIDHDPRSIVGLLVISACFALLGLWDDIRPLPAVFRLLAQFLLIGAGMIAYFALPPLGHYSAWAPIPLVLAEVLIALVAWINLFNFMDGIDGLAGSEAVFLLLAPLLLGCFASPDFAGNVYFWWAIAIAAATLAFLAFNWSPARIFMGDVGSVFLGWMTGIFAVLEIASGLLSLWQALIFPACFLTDSLVTLGRRALQGEAVWQAHRRHAYQHLSRRFGSHRQVVLGVIVINLFWLLPSAMVAGIAPAPLAPLCAVVAYLPLVAIAVLAGAGRAEHA